MSSQALTWALSLLAAAFIPRLLGAEMTGRLHLAESLMTLGSVIATFGMDLHLTKQIARHPNEFPGLLANSLIARMLLLIPTAIIIFGYAIVANYDRTTISLLALLSMATALVITAGALTATLRGLENLDAVAFASIVTKSIVVVGAILLLLNGYGVRAVAVAAGVGAAVGLCLQIRGLRRVVQKLPTTTPATVEVKSIVGSIRAGAPYFGVGFSIALYLQVDAIAISLLVETPEVLGWYSVYDRLGGTLLFVPLAFIGVMLPVISRLHEHDRTHGETIIQQSFQMMMLISVPIGLGLLCLAKPFVELIYGAEYLGAGAVLQIGGVVTILTYLTTAFGGVLIATDRQHLLTGLVAAAALLTIPLDVVLVPLFQNQFDNGAIGGAVTYGITESLVLAGMVSRMGRDELGAAPLMYAAKVLVAGLLMTAAVLPFRNSVIVMPIAIGAFVYIGAVWATGLVTPQQKAAVRSLVANRSSGALSNTGEG